MINSLSINIAKIMDGETFVINRGTDADIKTGQRFLIYGVGEEIIDPISKESLGKLELIRGTGKVIHVQDRMSIVKSDMKTSPLKTIRKSTQDRFKGLSDFNICDLTEEEILPPQSIPFEGLTLADHLRPI